MEGVCISNRLQRFDGGRLVVSKFFVDRKMNATLTIHGVLNVFFRKDAFDPL